MASDATLHGNIAARGFPVRGSLRPAGDLPADRRPGAGVIGISDDSVECHRLFSDTYSLNFKLLSDADGGIARQIGVPIRAGGKAMPADAAGKPMIGPNGNVVQFPRDFTAARWTFIIDPDGHVIYREMDVAPRTDTKEVLQFLRERKASQDF